MRVTLEENDETEYEFGDDIIGECGLVVSGLSRQWDSQPIPGGFFMSYGPTTCNYIVITNLPAFQGMPKSDDIIDSTIYRIHWGDKKKKAIVRSNRVTCSKLGSWIEQAIKDDYVALIREVRNAVDFPPEVYNIDWENPVSVLMSLAHAIAIAMSESSVDYPAGFTDFDKFELAMYDYSIDPRMEMDAKIVPDFGGYTLEDAVDAFIHGFGDVFSGKTSKSLSPQNIAIMEIVQDHIRHVNQVEQNTKNLKILDAIKQFSTKQGGSYGFQQHPNQSETP